MRVRDYIFRVIVFFFYFSVVFFIVRYFGLLDPAELYANIGTIAPFFSAINIIFSVISAFVIQTQWQKWDKLVDSSRGEMNMLRQFYVMAHHFPENIKNEIRIKICRYLEILIEDSIKNYKQDMRSKKVDTALYQLVDLTFNVSAKYPAKGSLVLSFLNRAMEYRERKLQNGTQHLPAALRLFLLSGMCSVIFLSFFIPFHSIFYDYLLSVIFSLLAFGIYLLIVDLDHPYYPAHWGLTINLYKELYGEINGSRDYKFGKAHKKG